MRFKQYITEIINLDKSLKGISSPNKVTWVFYINDIKFRAFITDMAINVGSDYVSGYEIFFQTWSSDKNEWIIDHFKSKINAGVLGGKVISILYDIIMKYNPQAIQIRAYNNNLIKLYDLTIGKYNKLPPFSRYTRYTKMVDGIKTYTLATGLNEVQDLYMFNRYTNIGFQL